MPFEILLNFNQNLYIYYFLHAAFLFLVQSSYILNVSDFKCLITYNHHLLNYELNSFLNKYLKIEFTHVHLNTLYRIIPHAILVGKYYLSSFYSIN